MMTRPLLLLACFGFGVFLTVGLEVSDNIQKKDNITLLQTHSNRHQSSALDHTRVAGLHGAGYRAFKKLRKRLGSTSSTSESEMMAKIYNSKITLDYGGGESRQEIDRIIAASAAHAEKKHRPYVMMEVGVFLGKSMARWLTTHRNVYAIGIDPFDGPDPMNSKVKDVPLQWRQQFGHPNFNRHFAEYVIRKESGDLSASRHVTVTGFSPEAATPVLASLKIDLFYIDARPHTGPTASADYWNESLSSFHAHNPDAIIAGDDWQIWYCPQLQIDSLKAFAKESGMDLAHNDRTWFMAKKLQQYLDADSRRSLKFEATGASPTLRDIRKKAEQYTEKARRAGWLRKKGDVDHCNGYVHTFLSQINH